MTIVVKQAIYEHDVVALTDTVARAESVGTWPAGTIGTVIGDYGEHKLIDIANRRGETVDMPVVTVEKLELVSRHR
ncbi:MAG TPA: hypothetical protein VK756_06375 [Solirubrobacteraceae bacterium]|jgi:hypothetical protein|nr:hypothetical protein [Solirubrobacteraceae bacterium]